MKVTQDDLCEVHSILPGMLEIFHDQKRASTRTNSAKCRHCFTGQPPRCELYRVTTPRKMASLELWELTVSQGEFQPPEF